MLFFVVLKKRPKKLFLGHAKKALFVKTCNEKQEIAPKKKYTCNIIVQTTTY
jgi:hypothetical protein